MYSFKTTLRLPRWRTRSIDSVKITARTSRGCAPSTVINNGSKVQPPAKQASLGKTTIHAPSSSVAVAPQIASGAAKSTDCLKNLFQAACQPGSEADWQTGRLAYRQPGRRWGRLPPSATGGLTHTCSAAKQSSSTKRVASAHSRLRGRLAGCLFHCQPASLAD